MADVAVQIPLLHIPKASPAVTSARIVVVGASIGGLATAACLRSAGFTNIRVFEAGASDRPGAGIALSDATVGILKALGVARHLQGLRLVEERTADGRALMRQSFPGFSILYRELRDALAELLPPGAVTYHTKVERAEEQPDGLHVYLDSGEELECDLLIAADGARSGLRKSLFPDGDRLRYAGYTAWRGIVPKSQLPPHVHEALYDAFPDLGNCVYFAVSSSPRQHAVLYDIGEGLLNWLVYENQPGPLAPNGQAICSPTVEDVAHLKAHAERLWGAGLGGLIAATATPFQNDIYDLEQPLHSFHGGRIVLLGDAAHPMTPHLAKGANSAIEDAFMLAVTSATSPSLAALADAFSEARTAESRRWLLASRHQGRLRNGLIAEAEAATCTEDASVYAAWFTPEGLSSGWLPTDKAFDEIWEHVAKTVPQKERGCYLSYDPIQQTPVSYGGA